MSPQPSPSAIGSWAKAIVAWAVLFFWLTSLTAGITGSACRKDRYEGAKKLRFCEISLTAGFWMDALSSIKAKQATIHLERGIALSQLGRNAEAIGAFHTALDNARATNGNGTWFGGLHSRMADLTDSHAFSVWTLALKSFKY